MLSNSDLIRGDPGTQEQLLRKNIPRVVKTQLAKGISEIAQEQDSEYNVDWTTPGHWDKGLYAVSVSEVYSPPRLTARAAEFGLLAGSALDLTTGWDFNKRSDRHAAMLKISQEDPHLLLLCPPCRVWSKLRTLSNSKRDPKVVEREITEAKRHLRFLLGASTAATL